MIQIPNIFRLARAGYCLDGYYSVHQFERNILHFEPWSVALYVTVYSELAAPVRLVSVNQSGASPTVLLRTVRQAKKLDSIHYQLKSLCLPFPCKVWRIQIGIFQESAFLPCNLGGLERILGSCYFLPAASLQLELQSICPW